jgi:3-hydroxyacyl-[acyl-carrier-protein] dehydratase
MTEQAAAGEEVGIADIQRILEMIPHRYPLLLVDKVRDIVKNESATGIKNVTFNEPHFQGHFPGHPVMPGVLIVEAMAQTAAVIAMHSLSDDAAGKLVYFMSIDNCKFRKPVVPGDVLELRMTLDRRRGAVWRFNGVGMVDGEKCAEALIAAMIMDV